LNTKTRDDAKTTSFPQRLVDICGYKLPTNSQNFTQKDFIELKIFQKVLVSGGYFFETPCIMSYWQQW